MHYINLPVNKTKNTIEAIIQYRDLDKRFDSTDPGGIYQLERVEFFALPRVGERVKHHRFDKALKVIQVTHEIKSDGFNDVILLCMHD
jgi:hypothetical protein